MPHLTRCYYLVCPHNANNINWMATITLLTISFKNVEYNNFQIIQNHSHQLTHITIYASSN
jgi:hypothetical protein